MSQYFPMLLLYSPYTTCYRRRVVCHLRAVGEGVGADDKLGPTYDVVPVEAERLLPEMATYRISPSMIKMLTVAKP